MTIVFQGHVKSISMNTSPLGKVAVTIQLPMAEAGAKELTIFVPQDEAYLWSPCYTVSFTVYAINSSPQRLVAKLTENRDG